MLIKIIMSIIIIVGISGANFLFYTSLDDLTEDRELKAIAGVMAFLIFSAFLVLVVCRGVLE